MFEAAGDQRSRRYKVRAVDRLYERRATSGTTLAQVAAEDFCPIVRCRFAVSCQNTRSQAEAARQSFM